MLIDHGKTFLKHLVSNAIYSCDIPVQSCLTQQLIAVVMMNSIYTLHATGLLWTSDRKLLYNDLAPYDDLE